jgi:23S rRNA (uracil1939-C5)-methyltransferase
VKKQKKKIILENVLVSDYAAEGKALAKVDGKVIFISGAVPGDTADIFLTKNKKDWAEGRVQEIKTYSAERTEPFCKHFGVCGGCKWQMLPYAKQLQYKQQEVEQNLRRIGKVELPPIMTIIGADTDKYYRNKLEFTFSNKRYLLPGEMDSSRGEALSDPDKLLNDDSIEEAVPTPSAEGGTGALGYHAPRIFDKIIDIDECYLMDDVNNAIRNTIRSFALDNNFSFYDIRKHHPKLYHR